MSTNSVLDYSVVAADLRVEMEAEKVVVTGEDAYDDVRQVWNGAVDHRPALFAMCEIIEDVQAAVQIACRHDFPFSVRGGGHDWAGRALRHAGLVIDLSRMRQVDVDAAGEAATLAGGALASDVIAATIPRGLAAVTPNVGAVGMAGFLLAGGYGPLNPRFGLAIDNLLGAEVVLANGSRVYADDSQNSDLFWALRGGGGNFGVVTSMRIRLHPLAEVLAGMILFPWADAGRVLQGHAEIMSSAPEELSVLAGGLTGPDGSPALFLGPIWSGKRATGEKYIASLETLGKAILSQVSPMSLAQLLGLYDSQVVNGRHYDLRTRWLPDLTPDIIAAIVAGGSARTSAHSMIALHHFHGAGTKIAPDATAFCMRGHHFMVEIIAAWETPSVVEAELHRQWMSDLSQVLASHALPGGYANFLTSDSHDQIAHAYGANARRLRDLKRKFDPGNRFSSAIPLP